MCSCIQSKAHAVAPRLAHVCVRVCDWVRSQLGFHTAVFNKQDVGGTGAQNHNGGREEAACLTLEGGRRRKPEQTTERRDVSRALRGRRREAFTG